MKTSGPVAPVGRTSEGDKGGKTPREGLRRRFYTLRYNVGTAITSPSWWGRAALALGGMAAISVPVFAKFGWTGGGLHIGFQLLLLAVRAWTQSAPQNLAQVERSSNRRRLALYKLVQQMNQRMSLMPWQVGQFQQEVLALVASYVRDHRGDYDGTKVFVNLLVERGDVMEVIARDKDHRVLGRRIPKAHSIAWEAMRSGNEVYTGQLYEDYPDTELGKKYESVLAIPVRFGTTIVGVVTIDSESAFHFEGEVKKVTTLVMPYIAMLGWTLQDERRAA
ncbi:GAF domain-containing protein [Archangium lansingense]|uniref:GAF domain-containing protein n=1 Tax=Archangium lansingense TaxID=2995310 RepID=UPI003B784D48